MTTIIYGLHTIQTAVKQDSKNVTRIYLSRTKKTPILQTIIDSAKQYSIPIQHTAPSELDQLTKTIHHQGIAAQIKKPTVQTLDDLKNLFENSIKPPFLLLLDCIQDPHNLGACLRTADIAGAQAVIAPKDKSASLTPAVRKIASGAAEYIPFIQVTNLAQTMKKLKNWGIWLVGADSHAKQNLFETDLTGPLGIVLGNEATGLRRLTKEHCDFLCKIPQFGHIASLNVSVAAGIFMFEAVRQRR